MSEFEIVYFKNEEEEEDGKNNVGEYSGYTEGSSCSTNIIQSSDTLSIIKSEAGIDLYDVEGDYCEDDSPLINGDAFDDEDDEEICDSKDGGWMCGKRGRFVKANI